jgi:hypothetical protein
MQALGELDELHRAGKITDAQYDLHKAKLMREAGRLSRPLGIKLLIWAAWIVGVVIVLQILTAILTGGGA